MTELLSTLQDFYRDKLTMFLRHRAGAQLIAQYDVNNTYQYVVNREETQLSWIAPAIADLGGTVPEAPDTSRAAAGKGAELAHRILDEDAKDAAAFVERWRPRVDAVVNARHRGMLRVILGETQEQQRFFEQALAGRTDLLGRRGEAAGKVVGAVLPTRWVE